LEAVGSGLRRMEAWARAQGIPDAQLKVLSDTIEALVQRGTLDQLIVWVVGW